MRNFILALSFIFSSSAFADGSESYKGAGYVTDYGGQNDSSRRRSDVRDYLTASERRILKRIHADASARREGRVVRKYRTAAYRDEPIPVRYVERRNAPSSLYVKEGDRRCQAAVKATGAERGTMARALKSARERWRASVIDDFGYGYANLANAVDVRTPEPSIIRHNNLGWPVYVAHIRARPCRDL